MKFQIEGYENMTPEEKVAALEAYEPTDVVSKATFDKTASELAAAKKRERERMTEEEAKAAKAAEEYAALVERAEKAENALAVSTYVAAYTAMGYDEKLARATAEAMVKGDTDTILKNQKLHLENREKALKAELLKQTPPPAAGGSDTGMKKEEFAKLSLLEKQKFATENPEIYKSFYKEE
jgi:hypothetical protein